VTLLNSLAAVRRNRGDTDGADALSREALEMKQRLEKVTASK
jgi:hypothetical protein